MDVSNIVAIVAVIISIGSLVVTSRKAKADVAVQYETMASKQAKDIAELRIEVNDLKDRIEEYEDGIKILIEQLLENKLTPRWRPKPTSKQKAEAAP